MTPDWSPLYAPGMPGTVTATVISDGAVSTVSGQWWREREGQSVDFVDLGRLESRFQAPSVRLANLSRGDLLIVAGTTYRISSADDDGHGVTTLGVEPVSSGAMPTAARYWRIKAAAPSWSDAYSGIMQSIRELELYASGDASGANLISASATVSASSTSPSNPPEQGADGNPDTRWESAGTDPAPTWTVDLGADLSAPVRSLRLRAYQGFHGLYLAQQITLQASSDGGHWADIATWDTAETDDWQTWENIQ